MFLEISKYNQMEGDINNNQKIQICSSYGAEC